MGCLPLRDKQQSEHRPWLAWPHGDGWKSRQICRSRNKCEACQIKLVSPGLEWWGCWGKRWLLCSYCVARGSRDFMWLKTISVDRNLEGVLTLSDGCLSAGSILVACLKHCEHWSARLWSPALKFQVSDLPLARWVAKQLWRSDVPGNIFITNKASW